MNASEGHAHIGASSSLRQTPVPLAVHTAASSTSPPAARPAAAPPPPHPGPAGSPPQCAPAAPGRIGGSVNIVGCMVNAWVLPVGAGRPCVVGNAIHAASKCEGQPTRTWFSSVHSVSRSLRSQVMAHGASGLPVALQSGTRREVQCQLQGNSYTPAAWHVASVCSQAGSSASGKQPRLRLLGAPLPPLPLAALLLAAVLLLAHPSSLALALRSGVAASQACRRPLGAGGRPWRHKRASRAAASADRASILAGACKRAPQGDQSAVKFERPKPWQGPSA